jgi:hypothetical protein
MTSGMLIFITVVAIVVTIDLVTDAVNRCRRRRMQAMRRRWNDVIKSDSHFRDRAYLDGRPADRWRHPEDSRRLINAGFVRIASEHRDPFYVANLTTLHRLRCRKFARTSYIALSTTFYTSGR